jgi:hypothetical protein
VRVSCAEISNSKQKATAMRTYKVGKNRPPQHSQFQPGQSGNPSGRRKGGQNFQAAVAQALMMRTRINQSGRAKKVPTQTALLMLLREQALAGDRWSIKMLLELGLRHNNETPAPASDRTLPPEDRAILEAFRAEIAAKLITPAASQAAGVAGPAKRKRRSTP